jgi:transposase
MSRFVGLDLHKRVLEVCIIDAAGVIVQRERRSVERSALLAWAQCWLQPTDQVAVEATTNTWPVVELLQPYVAEVMVSNPLRTRAIAEAKVKTDKVDAHTLAQLLRTDYLPRVWQPDAATQRLRRLTSRRSSLVHDRTTVKNRLHAVLHQRLIVLPEQTDLFSAKGVRWLRSLELDADGGAAIASELRLLASIEQEIATLDETLLQLAAPDPRVKLLVTLPGVDVTCALALLAALGDLRRFRDADHAASYVGLVPSTKQSAARTTHGPITKAGNSQARWLLVQAAQHLARHPGPLGVFFRRLKAKKNHNVAVVATARKLVTIAWQMLMRNEPYRYAQPLPTAQKLSRLRLAGGGARRKSGSAKGTKSCAKLPGGSRTIAALATVYAAEELPPLRKVRPGEARLQARPVLAAYVASLAQPQVRPRVPAGTPRQARTQTAAHV